MCEVNKENQCRKRTFGTEILNLNIANTSIKPQIVSDEIIQETNPYTEEIIAYLDETEITCLAPPGYFQLQVEIIPRMRTILVDWMIEVSNRFSFKSETIFLAVNLLDRYLSLNETKKFQLQLVGIAALFIAGKYIEVKTPLLNDFVTISGNNFSKFDILRIEGAILKSINFALLYVSPLQFLAGLQRKVQKYAELILQLSLYEYECLNFQPSLLASSAIKLASQKYQYKMSKSLYSDQSMEDCIQILAQLISNQENYKSVLKRQLLDAN